MTDLKPDEKLCPFCAETIKAAAVKCRYCQSDLSGPETAGEVPRPPVAARAPTTGTGPASSDVLVEEREELPPPPPDLPPAPRAAEPIPFWASFTLLKILVPLVLVLAIVAGYAWWRSEHPDEGKAPNGAITSVQARDAGMQAATQLTQKVLSFDWSKLDADTQAAEAVMAPSFRREYADQMAKLKAQTIKNQVKLTANAVATSIVSATDKKVVALVFVNQVTTAKGTNNQRVDSSRVLVTLTRDGGEWRISKLKPF